jgi:hypothetical protein
MRVDEVLLVLYEGRFCEKQSGKNYDKLNFFVKIKCKK